MAIEAFAGGVRRLDEARPAVPGGPVMRAEARAGGPVWIVTDADLARQVLADPRISKDPALAPPAWDPHSAGLEPPAAAQPALTTLDGDAHTALRRAHAPLLSARRVQERADRIAGIARDLLAERATAPGPVDLVAGFSTDYPLTVLCDLLGGPLGRVAEAAAACGASRPRSGRGRGGDGCVHGAGRRRRRIGCRTGRRAARPPPGRRDGRRPALPALRAAVLNPPRPSSVGPSIPRIAGQLTTDEAVGHLVARLLGPERPTGPAVDLVHDVLRRHPPALFTLWRFTTTAVDLAGVALPAGAPVLVDIAGITARAPVEPAFGAGPHYYCIGAQLALVELTALVEVLRADFPQARLAVPDERLRRADRPGLIGSRIVELPVLLR